MLISMSFEGALSGAGGKRCGSFQKGSENRKRTEK